jgi:hypothetical protein
MRWGVGPAISNPYCFASRGVSMSSSTLLERVDHLVYATADLDRGVAEIELLLGIRASPGGRHPAWGTRNALVALGSMSYL